MTPQISRIRIFPVKSLDHVELNEVQISYRSLLHDREFALFDEYGKFVNGKKTHLINNIRTSYDLKNYTAEFRIEGTDLVRKFHLLNEQTKINEYFSEYFGYKVFIKQNSKGRFLDVPDISGLTIVSESTLKSLSEYFPEIPLDKMRRRFRANIELSGINSFREDDLFNIPGKAVCYKIGDVTFYGISPRARCIVPTRDPDSGDTYPYFTKEFVEFRKQSLPADSLITEYEHYYFLTVDTFIPESEEGKFIKKGDELEIKEVVDLNLLNLQSQ